MRIFRYRLSPETFDYTIVRLCTCNVNQLSLIIQVSHCQLFMALCLLLLLSLSSITTGFLSPGTSLEPVAHPTTQTSTFRL